MSPGPKARPKLLLLASLATIAIAAARQPAAAQTPRVRDLLLDVVVNGRSIGMVGEFQERDGKLFATPVELDTLGFRLRGVAPLAGAPAPIPLSQLPGLSYRLDEPTQTVYVTAANAALKPSLLTNASIARDLPVESGFGAVTNYDLVTTHAGGQTLAEALLDARVFSPWGVFSTAGIGTAGAAASIQPVVRLDSTYTYSNADTLRRYRAGDIITGGLSWTRPIRLGGLQATTDFGIRPDLVTFPVPTLTGQVAVPSSVDVLVNGVQLLSHEVTPGPFEVRQLPIVTGAGNVSVVVRDALGQQTTQTLPVYSSTLLLSPDLSALSAELGMVRLNFGTVSNDYRTPAGSFTYRRGVWPWLTLEGHGEGSGGGGGLDGAPNVAGGMGGAGVAFTIGSLGVVGLDGAFSHFGNASGSLASASFERISPVFSVSGSIQVTQGGFADVAASLGDPVPTVVGRGSVGLSLGNAGSLGLAYVDLRRSQSKTAQQAALFNAVTLKAYNGVSTLSLLPATKVSLLSMSYSRPLLDRAAYLFATGYNDFASHGSYGVVVGITFPLGRRNSVSVTGGDDGSGGRGPYGTLQATRSTSEIGDVGGQLLDNIGGSPRQMGMAEYRSPYALLDAGVDRTEGRAAYRATAQGAVSYVDGSLFASNTIADSFAVVDTDETTGVEVLQENRPVGVTGSSGLLLVPGLRSFDANRVGINPVNLPVDVEFGQTSRMVRPQDRSGVIVHFPVRASHGALVRLVDKNGVAVAVGSVGQLAGGAAGGDVIVGYDGEAFITGLQPHNTLKVTPPKGPPCVAAFDYTASPGSLPEIGPVLCRTAAP